MSTRTRAPLTRTRVLGAALDLVDREGSAALTMRNLGRVLDVEAMSLYHHVRSREDLLDGLVEVMVGELPVADEDQDWDAALRDFVLGIRATALRHPDAFQLVGLRPLQGPTAHTNVRALLQRLRHGGLPPDLVAATFRLAVAYARGFALAEISGFTLGSEQDAADAEVRHPLAGLVPALAAEPGTTFARGLDILVAGVRAQLTRDAPPS